MESMDTPQTQVCPPARHDPATVRWLLRVLNGSGGSADGLPASSAEPSEPTRPDSPAPATATSPQPTPPIGKGLRVWVVDDDAAVALFLSELLLDFGFEVASYTDAHAALEAFRAEPDGVDVVITDQRMPRLSGDELARAMLDLRPQQRVILCTGYSDSIDRDKARAMGISAYFKKPFDSAALVLAITGAAAQP